MTTPTDNQSRPPEYSTVGVAPLSQATDEQPAGPSGRADAGPKGFQLLDEVGRCMGAVIRARDRRRSSFWYCIAGQVADGLNRLGTGMKLFVLAVILSGNCNSIGYAQWRRQTVDSNEDFCCLCVVSPKVAWVGGAKWTYGRTT